MARGGLLSVIEGCYAAALEAAAWPDALTAFAEYLGGTDGTLEVHRGPGEPPVFFASGRRLPQDGVDAYLAHYLGVCPRVPYLMRRRAGEIGLDYDFISESEMDRDEFYADFPAPADLRYFMSTTLETPPGATMSFAAVHRSPRQGHATRRARGGEADASPA